MAESKDARSTEELMDLNNLAYSVPGNLALTEEGAVYKKNSADQQTYTSSSGTEMVITVQSSTDFVYGPNCYLRFDVKADGLVTTSADDVAVGFLNSPATALFQEFLLEDKSGAELERVRDVNKAVRSILPWKYPEEYRRSCEMAGQKYGKNVVTNGGVYTSSDILVGRFALHSLTAVGTGSYVRVCIPLWYFSGLFAEETLIPPSLISGARFRMTLAPVLEALSIIGSNAGSTPAGFDASSLTYTISDPVLMIESYSMAPAVQRNIMEQMGSRDGLPYTYSTLYAQTGNPGTATDYTLQINKAVARAQKIYTSTQNVIADNASLDNLGSCEVPYYQYQTRVGDLFLPQQTMQLGSVDTHVGSRRNCAELYANNLQCTMGLRDPYHDPSVSLEDFRTSHTSSTITDYKLSNSSDSLIIQTLNQSAHIGQSGVSVNNSRTAEQRIRYNAGETQDKQIISWLEYVKLASVWPMRTVVKQ